jgi:hypothetical protein
MNIELKDAKTSYRPGEAVDGEACWDLDPAPPALVLRLCYRAEASGFYSGEPVAAAEVRIESPAAGHAHHPFSFKAPAAPWSFTGALFSIRWFVCMEDGAGHTGETEIVIAPEGRPLTAPAPAPRAS